MLNKISTRYPPHTDPSCKSWSTWWDI